MAKRFHMPAKGARNLRIRDVRISRAGRQFTASWHVADGTLFVDSAYGSRSEAAGQSGDHAARATALLDEIVGR